MLTSSIAMAELYYGAQPQLKGSTWQIYQERWIPSLPSYNKLEGGSMLKNKLLHKRTPQQLKSARDLNSMVSKKNMSNGAI